MATQLFFTSGNSDVASGNNDARLNTTASAWTVLLLSTARGSGATSLVTDTVAGPTNGVEVGVASGSLPRVWYSPPLDADITISGSITWNLRVAESAAAANVAINGRLEVIDGATGAFTLIDQTARVVEIVGATETANNFSETPGAGVACKRGDRLRVRVFGDDATGVNMGSGRTFTFWYAGAAGATGDSYVTLTEDLTFASEPAGSQVFLTDTASAVTAASPAALLSSFTGSDESPLSEGGNWAKLNSSDTGTLARVSNAATSGAAGRSWDYWTPADYGPDVEAYLTVTALGSAQASIMARISSDAGGAGTWDGYLVGLSGTTLSLSRYTNATFASIASNVDVGAVAAGAKIGIACHGSTIEGWYQPAGGAWRRSIMATDPTYAAAGKVGFGGSLGVATLDDVYAGTTIGGSFSGGLTEREAWTSRGAGVQTDVVNTAAGWTSPIQMTDTAGGTVVDWFTRPLTAFTLGGAVRCAIRALESISLANASIGVEIARVEGDGTSPSVWALGIARVEIATTEFSFSFLVSGDDLAISDGQRLRIRLYIDDSAIAAMATSYTVTTYYAGAAAATGDTYVTFTQTLTEYAPAAADRPVGPRVYPQILAH